MVPTSFTASNPIAYGNDAFYLSEWRDEYVLDRRHVDQFYIHNLLRQISADTANRLAYSPYTSSFPWVSRWLELGGAPDATVPDMSRPAYREALRHMWLRGIDGMQLFNSRNAKYEELWLQELQDAVGVYDEVLAYPQLLADGEVMNLAVPAAQDDGVLWSGLRLKDRALVRVVSQGEVDSAITLEAWPGLPVMLEARREGRTYTLTRLDDDVQVAY